MGHRLILILVLALSACFPASSWAVANQWVPPGISQPHNDAQQGHIVECKLNFLPRGSLDWIAFEQFQHSLARGITPKKRLAHALFAEVSHNLPDGNRQPQLERQSRRDLLLAYNRDFPGNKNILMKLVGLCADTPNHPGCQEELFAQAIALDGDNAALWYRIANHHARLKDKSMTIAALKRLSEASHYDSYYFAGYRLYLRLRGNAGLDTPYARAGAATLVLQSNLWSHGILSQFCRQNVHNNEEIATLCLALGRRLVNNSQTLIDTAMGHVYQDLVYETRYSQQSRIQVKERSMHGDINYNQLNKATYLAFFDRSLLWSWFSHLETMGELPTSKWLIKEAISRSKNNNYAPCPGRS